MVLFLKIGQLVLKSMMIKLPVSCGMYHFDFKNSLNNLHDLVMAGAKDTNKFNSMYQQTMEEIDGAISNLPSKKRQNPKFVLQVINELLDTAGAEYEAAILDGKIVEVIEYQDSRGFVDYAEILYKNIADTMGSKYSDIDLQTPILISHRIIYSCYAFMHKLLACLQDYIFNI